jgi:hypothetical protein
MAASDSTQKAVLHPETGDELPDEQEYIVADPELRGQMTMTTTLAEAAGGTDVLVVHEGIPDKVPVADNEMGARMALANLAKLVEVN